jgi:ligand-binding sensor domain-containing protein/signal transduction histidine kinase
MLKKSLWGILLFLHLTSYAQTSDLQIFDDISNEDALSQGSINAICQDLTGYIWIGTKDGLNRYDGYDIKIYRNDPTDNSSISCNVILVITRDSKGYLWIGTSGGGLNRYDPFYDNFTRYKFYTNEGKEYGKIINSIEQDKFGNLWIGTYLDGLIRFHPEIGSVKRFLQDTEDSESISDNTINALLIDSYDRLWIGVEDSCLNLFLPESESFKRFIYQNKISLSPYGCSTSALIEDKENNIWIGTKYGDFVFKFYPDEEKFFSYREGFPGTTFCFSTTGGDSIWMGSNYSGLFLYEISKDKTKFFSSGVKNGSLNYNTIKSLYHDRDENLWIGTDGKGLNLYSPHKKKFQSYFHKSPSTEGLSVCSVRAIYVDENDILWVGGYRISNEYEGLSRINLKTNEITQFDPDGVVYTILPDKENKNVIWLGTEGQGIIELRTDKLKSTVYGINPPFTIDLIKGMIVYNMKYDKKGNLYIGTDKGLNVINAESKLCTFYSHNPLDSLSINVGSIMAIYIDSMNNIWIGSNIGGLSKFNPVEESFERYTVRKSKASCPSSNCINCFYEDTKKRFWVGTDKGLNLFDRKTGGFTVYTVKQGLPNDVIYAVLEDELGNLWLSTNKGLCKFNPESNDIYTYDKNDGLPANEFNKAAYFKSNDGRLLFGGTNGLVSFYPSEINNNQSIPNVVITSYFIDNIEIQPDTNISLKKMLIVEPGTYLIGFQVSAMSFLNPEKCNYKYKLDGFMDKWIEMGRSRNISFTNLDPGEYTLYIKSSNSDGIWSKKPTKLDIKLSHFFYQTMGFKFLVTFIVIVMLLTIYFGRISILRRQEKKLKILVDQRTFELSETNQQLSIASKTKDKLYSIIAHDLKSPFNSLLGFTNLLLENWKDMNDDERLEIINILKNTSSSTYDLLVNLLEWSQFQSGDIKYNPEKIALCNLINDSIVQFNGQANLKNINVSVKCEQDLVVFVDIMMITSVLRNLCSNAIKFTPPKGKVNIEAYSKDDYAYCLIKDNGVGISKENQNNLFQSEYSLSTEGTKGEKGTGLGLMLCKTFIQKNKGKISFESELNKGSTFIISMPMSK